MDRQPGSVCAALAVAIALSFGTFATASGQVRHAQVYLDSLGEEEPEGGLEEDPDQLLKPDTKQGEPESEPPLSAQERKSDKLDLEMGNGPLLKPLDRPKLLAQLYEQLGRASDLSAAEPVMEAIEELWRVTGSDTINVLLSRAEHFLKERDLALSLKILDAAVELAPDDAQVRHQRAKVHALRGNLDLALADLKRALSLDPKHYRAMNDLGRVFEEMGAKKDALQAYRRALAVNPFLEETSRAVEVLSREVEGQPI